MSRNLSKEMKTEKPRLLPIEPFRNCSEVEQLRHLNLKLGGAIWGHYVSKSDLMYKTPLFQPADMSAVEDLRWLLSSNFGKVSKRLHYSIISWCDVDANQNS